MGMTSVRAAAILGALSFVLSVGLAGPATAAVSAYPSWDEIEAARGDEAATAAALITIDAALDELQEQAAVLGDTAVAREAEATSARNALERASLRASSLAESAADASDAADASAAQAAQIAAALYRSGGTDLTSTLILVSNEDSTELLYKLGALDKVGGQLDQALERAENELNLSLTLSAQATIARQEREQLSSEARASLAAAAAASAEADAAVVEQQERLTVLYQQLASVKNSTVELEQQYRIGRDAVSGVGTGGASPSPGSGSEGSSGTTSGGASGGTGSGGSNSNGSGGFAVPGNEVNNAAAAQDFAFAQSSARGWGGDQHYCLLLLWNRESGWRTNAYNPWSGAYGIPQSLPGSKMGNYAADWRTNYQTQVMWGLLYISGRYGSPCGAWAHSESVGWY
jgi:hypothetical protein